MAWEFDELVRVHAEVLALSSTELLWERIEDVFWLRQELERGRCADKQRDRRSREHGCRYHREYERERRRRGRKRVAAIRCCPGCRKLWKVTAAQRMDNVRYCSLKCAAQHRVARGKVRPPRMVTIGKKTRPLPEWAAHFGITMACVYKRMREGMTDVEALTTPKTPGRRRAA